MQSYEILSMLCINKTNNVKKKFRAPSEINPERHDPRVIIACEPSAAATATVYCSSIVVSGVQTGAFVSLGEMIMPSGDICQSMPSAGLFHAQLRS